MNKKIFSFLLIKILIIEINSKQYPMHKQDGENNEFKQYIFNLSINDQISIYPSFFNMCSFYIHIFDKKEGNSIQYKDHINNIIINNQTFYYINRTKNFSEDYSASIGISKNFTNYKELSGFEPEYNLSDFSFLEMLKKEEENKNEYKDSYISFIQNENNEAIMSFGEYDSQFDTGDSNKCQSEFGYYFSCQISSIKIGVNEIYTTSTSKQEIGIFSISDEYLILPMKPGNETIFYYKNKIKELFGIECVIENEGNNNMVNMTCDYFNYEDLPDLYFEMKGGIGVMALSVDMFKILYNYKLEFKLKYRKIAEENSFFSKWILGEPVTKNYNFFANYTDKEKPYLIIVPSSLNGFILILIATIGGFLFLFIFLTIIYCSSKKENKFKNNIFEKNSSRSNFFSLDKNNINETIEEHEDEIEENEKEEDNKSENIFPNEFNDDKNEEIKNLKINEIQKDNSNNNKKKMSEKDINNNEKMKEKQNGDIELITNNHEEISDEKDSLM